MKIHVSVSIRKLWVVLRQLVKNDLLEYPRQSLICRCLRPGSHEWGRIYQYLRTWTNTEGKHFIKCSCDYGTNSFALITIKFKLAPWGLGVNQLRRWYHSSGSHSNLCRTQRPRYLVSLFSWPWMVQALFDRWSLHHDDREPHDLSRGEFMKRAFEICNKRHTRNTWNQFRLSFLTI